MNNKKSKLLTPCDCREPIHMGCLKMWIEIKKNPNIIASNNASINFPKNDLIFLYLATLPSV